MLCLSIYKKPKFRSQNGTKYMSETRKTWRIFIHKVKWVLENLNNVPFWGHMTIYMTTKSSSSRIILPGISIGTAAVYLDSTQSVESVRSLKAVKV